LDLADFQFRFNNHHEADLFGILSSKPTPSTKESPRSKILDAYVFVTFSGRMNSSPKVEEWLKSHEGTRTAEQQREIAKVQPIDKGSIRSPVPIYHLKPALRQGFAATLRRDARTSDWLLERVGFEASSPLEHQ
jgi:hypothetical protein